MSKLNSWEIMEVLVVMEAVVVMTIVIMEVLGLVVAVVLIVAMRRMHFFILFSWGSLLSFCFKTFNDLEIVILKNIR